MAHARGLLIAAAALAVSALGACSSSGDDVTATPSFDTVVSGAPEASVPAASVPAAGGPGAPSRGATYPGTTKAYCEAVLSAWKNGDTARLNDLTLKQSFDQIIAIPGPPDMNWRFIRAVPDGVSGETCSFYNAKGEIAYMRIYTLALGKPHAVLLAGFEVAVYPTETGSYISKFLVAWLDGNEPRMRLYGTAAVVARFKQIPTPTRPVQELGGTAGGLQLVKITVSPTLTVTVQVDLNLLGKPLAMVAIVE